MFKAPPFGLLVERNATAEGLGTSNLDSFCTREWLCEARLLLRHKALSFIQKALMV